MDSPAATSTKTANFQNKGTGLLSKQGNPGLSQDLKEIFSYNANWASNMKAKDANYFKQLAAQQSPKFLWIGCSDSRVPANQLMGLAPGEVFVHRNVANVVVHTDLNCLSVLQYAVEVLKVEHIIVCGHYACGGVRAAMTRKKFGLIDNWLRAIKDIFHRHHDELSDCDDLEEKVDRMCELNVREQVGNVCQTSIVLDAWKRGQLVAVHGWIYDIRDGLLRDLDLCVSSEEQVHEIYKISENDDSIPSPTKESVIKKEMPA